MKPFTLVVVVALVAVIAVGYLLQGEIVEPPELPPGGFETEDKSSDPATATPTPPPPQFIVISIIAAEAVEPWLSQAAEEYNAQGKEVDNQEVRVEVSAQDGFTAGTKWVSGDFSSFPAGWVAENAELIEDANLAASGGTGPDIFLLAGQYPAQSIATTPLVWGIWPKVFQALTGFTNGPQVSWDELHQGAEAGTWESPDGPQDLDSFRLAIPPPDRNMIGLGALWSAAGDFYDQTEVTVEELRDPDFLAWLGEILNSGINGDSQALNEMIYQGRSEGDLAHTPESAILRQMGQLVLLQGSPLQVVYPDPIVSFDFPFAIYLGPETSGQQKQIALEFRNFLLTDDQQGKAVEFGLRPVCAGCTASGGLFDQWKNQGVQPNIQSTQMLPAAIGDLGELVQWYKTNYP